MLSWMQCWCCGMNILECSRNNDKEKILPMVRCSPKTYLICGCWILVLSLGKGQLSGKREVSQELLKYLNDLFQLPAVMSSQEDRLSALLSINSLLHHAVSASEYLRTFRDWFSTRYGLLCQRKESHCLLFRAYIWNCTSCITDPLIHKKHFAKIYSSQKFVIKVALIKSLMEKIYNSWYVCIWRKNSTINISQLH